MENEQSMFIKKVIDYDQDAFEADLIVSDGTFDLLCYAQPFDIADIDEPFELTPLDYSDVMTCEERYVVEKTNDSYYSHRVQGKLLDFDKGIVAVGSIIIQDVSVIPKDIKAGQFIEFTCSRFDYMLKKR